MLGRIGRSRWSIAALLGPVGVLALALGMGVGCGDDDDSPTGSDGKFPDVRVLAGNNQTGQTGRELEQSLWVEVTDADGQPLKGVAVQFTVTAGGGALLDAAEPAATVTRTTGNDGRAAVHLRLGPNVGVNRVTATVAGMGGLPATFTAIGQGAPLDGDTQVDAERFADPGHFSLAPDQLNLAGGVRSGLQTRITAFVFDAAAHPVDEGTLLRFRTTGGGIEQSARTGAGGLAVVTLVTAQPVPADGWAVVTAEAPGKDGGTVTAQTRVLFSGATAITLIDPVPFLITPGQDQLLRFSVSDANGHPLVAGTTITVSTIGGTVVGQSRFVMPDTQSPQDTRFAVTFRSPADAEMAQVTIAVVSPNGDRELVLSGTDVARPKGPPASIALISADPPAIGVRGAGDDETSLVTFEVRDIWGNTVQDGEVILFAVKPGDLFSATARVDPDSATTVNGRVVAAVTSDTLAGTVQLVATARSRAAGVGLIHSEPVPVAIHGGHPHPVHFSVAPKPVNLAGRVLFGLESTVTAYVYDKYSNPVPNGTVVHFETSGGGVEGSGLTGVGQAHVRLFTAKPIPPFADDYFAKVTATTQDRAGNEISDTTTVLFSGPTWPVFADTALWEPAPLYAPPLNLVIADGGSKLVRFSVHDDFVDPVTGEWHPIMGGSTIKVISEVAKLGGDIDVVVPDARGGNTVYSILISDKSPAENPPKPPEGGVVLIKVQSLNGDRQTAIGVTID